ncbi:MAG: hypothetical protein JWQ71_2197 [Pedosphaera sp.]|nr:hypothetical protein [Pedosphaera sp.]
MFRYKNLIRETTPNIPDGPIDRLGDSDVPNEPETSGKNMVFLHGYNVNPNQARGWFCAMFKRPYWSGSRARFYGVNYRGHVSQKFGTVTVNFHTNEVSALLTAPKLKTFLDTLPGTNILAGHSLGNMVILGSLSDTNAKIDQAFMIDAALPIEAIDGGAIQSTNLVHPEWYSYEERLWASEWYQLFTSGDHRSELTWRDRLSGLANAQVYNFYSHGEEVLREYTGGTPPTLLLAAGDLAVTYLRGQQGLYTWSWQEMLKGRLVFDGVLGSHHAGWGFSPVYYTNTTGAIYIHMDAAHAAQLTDNQLQSK